MLLLLVWKLHLRYLSLENTPDTYRIRVPFPRVRNRLAALLFVLRQLLNLQLMENKDVGCKELAIIVIHDDGRNKEDVIMDRGRNMLGAL
jgi:hypothetical protein